MRLPLKHTKISRGPGLFRMSPSINKDYTGAIVAELETSPEGLLVLVIRIRSWCGTRPEASETRSAKPGHVFRKTSASPLPDPTHPSHHRYDSKAIRAVLKRIIHRTEFRCRRSRTSPAQKWMDTIPSTHDLDIHAGYGRCYLPEN